MIPSLTRYIPTCSCGRAPVLASGRCWTCEPKPTAATLPRSATHQDVLDCLVSWPGITSADIAAELAVDEGWVRQALQRLLSSSRARRQGDGWAAALGPPHQVKPRIRAYLATQTHGVYAIEIAGALGIMTPTVQAALVDLRASGWVRSEGSEGRALRWFPVGGAK